MNNLTNLLNANANAKCQCRLCKILAHQHANTGKGPPATEREGRQREGNGRWILTVSVNGWTDVSKGDFNVWASLNVTTIKILSHLRFSEDPSLRGIHYTGSIL